MFGLFKKKSKIDKLKDQFNKLQEEAFRLSTTDRMLSDQKLAEAETVWAEVEKLQKSNA